MPTVAFHNLGCKVNGYESDLMAQGFLAHGFSIVPFEETADVYVVNTCTVTGIADRKSRQMLHRARRLNQDAVIVAVGCYVETHVDALTEDTKVDLAIGNKNKAAVATHVIQFMEATDRLPSLKDVTPPLSSASASFVNNASAVIGDSAASKKTVTGHTRMYLKIQDGCNLFCSYCIIPYARGRSVSRTIEELLQETRSLAARGVKEIILTGIHISSFSAEQEEAPLLALLQTLHTVEGIERIRLSSLEPRIVTDAFAKGLARLPKVCPHFHLSLQSGDNATLMRMRRHYTAGEFKRCVNALRAVYENPAITTDIICGFPGETQKQFETTLEFVKEIHFFEVHAFPYSVREGTAAAAFPGQLTAAVKKARCKELITLSAGQAKAYRSLFLQTEVRVLWEEVISVGDQRFLIGHTERYVRIARDVSSLSEEEILRFPGTFESGIPTDFLDDETLLL